MRTSRPVAMPPHLSTLATFRALVDKLHRMDDVEFGDLDPRTLSPIPVPVSVKSNVISLMQRL